MAAGLLSGKYTRDNTGQAGGRRDKVAFPLVDTEKAFAILDVLRPMAEAKGVQWRSSPWPGCCTNRRQHRNCGCQQRRQLADNLGATGIAFTPDELKQLDEVSRLVPSTRVGWSNSATPTAGNDWICRTTSQLPMSS
jgi:aryl-alcohol dehydrogenase-like predicted oxidoreductase